ncbi:uncharacterized protein cubi_02632 [Cryptosporidium ubiquitum]|uniref:CS domain-containing protein n=1 Tax=Cryptosporidium ubiquitum TaxID=857276 RepID=A0A1J4MK74_9CRYT|nr:uncharacterized protein cubi_02632 [Cryptosporidium ubiquitum]OII73420.1 hypothetical protein cubi_02632 [Cryptosporidium ubiquitum]
MSSNDKEISALRNNIKEKGEFSYYYAHKNNSHDLKDAKIFEGPGIVTGGEPILLHKDDKKENTSEKPRNVQIKKYSWSDCGESIEIYISLQDLADLISSKSPLEILGKPNLEVTNNTISLEVLSENTNFLFKIANLSNPIDSQLSRVKVSTKKITVICFKEDSDLKWNSLCRPML